MSIKFKNKGSGQKLDSTNSVTEWWKDGTN